MDAFAIVIWIVGALGILAAFLTLAGAGKQWEGYGRSLLSLERDTSTPSPGSVVALRERDEEIRQMLDARNALRSRRGREVVDVDRELARLTAPSVDPAVREEIREVVVACNYRLERAGKAPLDIEREVERRIAQLDSP
jgi:hypothetical protein